MEPTTTETAFLEAISSFGTMDFSESTNDELWNWKSIPEPTDNQLNFGVNLLGGVSGSFLVQNNFHVTTGHEPRESRKRTFQSLNNNYLVEPLCLDGLEEFSDFSRGVLSPTSISPSSAARKAAKLLMDANLAYQRPVQKPVPVMPKPTKQQAKIKPSPIPVQSQSPSTSPIFSGSPYASTGTSGENRLRVNFLNLGTPGKRPQRFGKSGCCIPDGLCGTHEMYDQQWKFEIIHSESCSSKSDEESLLITWRITNLTSGTVVELKETSQQAILREYSGRTICNKVVKMAMAARVAELEKLLEHTVDKAHCSSIENSIRVLKPRLCTVGLLFFGLLHEACQGRFAVASSNTR